MPRQSSFEIDIKTPLSAPPPPAPPLSAPSVSRVLSRRGKVLAGASNLANLLPTGTVMTFQTLMPSFTDGGSCLIAHKYLTLGLIIICAAACFFSSFTDSFIDQNGKIHYGIAYPRGFCVFNYDHHDQIMSKQDLKEYLKSYSLTKMDFIRALVSLMVFLMFAMGDANVQDCYWPKANPNMEALFMNLPLAAAFFATFFFTIFPTTRRGIGYADSPREDTNHLPLLPKNNKNPKLKSEQN